MKNRGQINQRHSGCKKKRGSENIAVRDIAKENRGQETVEKKGVVLGKEKGGRV